MPQALRRLFFIKENLSLVPDLSRPQCMWAADLSDDATAFSGMGNGTASLISRGEILVSVSGNFRAAGGS